jgi:hypothetical protein
LWELTTFCCSAAFSLSSASSRPDSPTMIHTHTLMPHIQSSRSFLLLCTHTAFCFLLLLLPTLFPFIYFFVPTLFSVAEALQAAVVGGAGAARPCVGGPLMGSRAVK